MADDASQVVMMKSMVDQLQQEKVSLLMAIESLVVRNETANSDTRQQFIKTILELERELEATRQESAQARVIGNASGGDSSTFSLRYRNDTALSNEAGIHRLEYIAKSSPYDPALLAAAGWAEADMDAKTYTEQWSVMWATGWRPVVGGDAVKYETGV